MEQGVIVVMTLPVFLCRSETGWSTASRSDPLNATPFEIEIRAPNGGRRPKRERIAMPQSAELLKIIKLSLFV